MLATLVIPAFARNNPAVLSTPKQQILKVGFVLQGSASDLDWSYAHEQGRRYLKNALKGKVGKAVELQNEVGQANRYTITACLAVRSAKFRL